MGIESFRRADAEAFLLLSDCEGWICDPWELEFLLDACPDGCFVWREEGRPVGFVTAIGYHRSGWVGNLVVAPHLRGLGVGTALMKCALAALGNAGVETVWLTASEAGERIYAGLGFQAIDTVCRWRGDGITPATVEPGLCSVPALDYDLALGIDRAGWGDDRNAIFAALNQRATLFASAESFLIRHPYGGGVQIGPWGGLSLQSAELLLQKGVQGNCSSHDFFLDVPAGNPHAPELLTAHGFTLTATTRLMFSGRPPSYNPRLIYSLASMGSFG